MESPLSGIDHLSDTDLAELHARSPLTRRAAAEILALRETVNLYRGLEDARRRASLARLSRPTLIEGDRP